MFWMRNKENDFPIHTFIWRPESGDSYSSAWGQSPHNIQQKVCSEQKKKFSQYRHCVQLFCRTVLILTKTLPNMKCIYFLSNVNIFNKNSEITSFFHQNYTKGSLSKFKFQNSKISLAPSDDFCRYRRKLSYLLHV